MCGLPGTGKTTHATTLEQRFSGVRFYPDEWLQQLGISLWEESVRTRIEALQWKIAQRLLELGGTVIIEWGTWGRAERDALRAGARALSAAVELHYLSAPLDELQERILKRGLEDPPIKRADLERWARAIEMPTPEEFALYDPPAD